MNKQKRFLVVSYDADQQQWFYDTVLAITAEKAAAFICRVRPYVADADAIPATELKQMAHGIATRSVESIRGTMAERAKDHAESEGDEYVPTNYFDAQGRVIATL